VTCVFVLKNYSETKFLKNGKDITIIEFAQLVADVGGYRGRFMFDITTPSCDRAVLVIAVRPSIVLTTGA
jgi:hypothetical protein